MKPLVDLGLMVSSVRAILQSTHMTDMVWAAPCSNHLAENKDQQIIYHIT
jgi:hypothetical protein